MKTPQQTLISRRTILKKMGIISVGAAPFLHACNSNPVPVEDTANNTSTGSCVLTPTESEGPYPLKSVLANPAINRRNITEGKPGIAVHLQIKLLDVNNGCAPITDAKVYIWHCDKDGVYSGYYQAGGETFCRGIQSVDAQGVCNFDTIYPGWYPGRVTHIHFQIYRDNQTITSQLAFPLTTNREVYAQEQYTLGQNSTVTRLSDDFEFNDDGATHQTVRISGTLETGLIATLEVGIRG